MEVFCTVHVIFFIAHLCTVTVTLTCGECLYIVSKHYLLFVYIAAYSVVHSTSTYFYLYFCIPLLFIEYRMYLSETGDTSVPGLHYYFIYD